jgi:hypothetical protein
VIAAVFSSPGAEKCPSCHLASSHHQRRRGTGKEDDMAADLKAPDACQAEPNLAALAEQANTEHRAFQTTMKAAIAHAIAAGEALIAAKRLLRHGEWLSWVNAHCDFTDRTARNYMRLAENRKYVSALSGVREALDALANHRDGTPPPRSYEVQAERGGTIKVGQSDPVRGLFAWMVPWVAQCPCCGTVRVYPKPLENAPPSLRTTTATLNELGGDVGRLVPGDDPTVAVRGGDDVHDRLDARVLQVDDDLAQFVKDGAALLRGRGDRDEALVLGHGTDGA